MLGIGFMVHWQSSRHWIWRQSGTNGRFSPEYFGRLGLADRTRATIKMVREGPWDPLKSYQ